MTFDAAALSRTCFAALGEAGTYTPAGGVAVPVTVTVERNAELGGISPQFGAVERLTVIALLKAEVSVPVRGAVIAVASGSFTVDRVLDDDGYVVRVVVK